MAYKDPTDREVEERIPGAIDAILKLLKKSHVPMKGGNITEVLVEAGMKVDSDITNRALHRLRVGKKICQYGNGFYTLASRPVPGAVPHGDDKWDHPGGRRPTPEQLNEAAHLHKQTIEAGKPLPPTPRRGTVNKTSRRKVQRKKDETRTEHITRLEDIDRMTGNKPKQEKIVTKRSVIEKSDGEDQVDALMAAMSEQPRFKIPPIDNLDYKAQLVRRMAGKLPAGVASDELSELAGFLVDLEAASVEYDDAMAKWEGLQL